MYRQFWLRDAAHINSIGLGNPLKRTCSTCHNAQMTGQDLSAGWVDVGTTNFPTWTEPATWADSSELPVFKITCSRDADPHPYLGRVIYTTDPGRALISGRCVDIGSIVMQQLRGLSARAPYFANGSAKTLREVVDYLRSPLRYQVHRPGEGRSHQLPCCTVGKMFRSFRIECGVAFQAAAGLLPGVRGLAVMRIAVAFSLGLLLPPQRWRQPSSAVLSHVPSSATRKPYLVSWLSMKANSTISESSRTSPAISILLS